MTAIGTSTPARHGERRGAFASRSVSADAGRAAPGSRGASTVCENEASSTHEKATLWGAGAAPAWATGCSGAPSLSATEPESGRRARGAEGSVSARGTRLRYRARPRGMINATTTGVRCAGLRGSDHAPTVEPDLDHASAGRREMHVSTSAPTTASAASHRLRWRVVDIVVASVIGVASGLIFLFWNIGYLGPQALLEPLLPGLQGLLDGPWLFAGVLGALIIRKPGDAIYTETLAAVVSALVGNQWGGFLTLEAGLVQGLGAELVFLAFLYRVWNLPVAMLAGAGAAFAGGINNLLLWYTGSGTPFTITYLISTVISGAVIAGLLPWVLTRGLARTGAL